MAVGGAVVMGTDSEPHWEMFASGKQMGNWVNSKEGEIEMKQCYGICSAKSFKEHVHRPAAPVGVPCTGWNILEQKLFRQLCTCREDSVAEIEEDRKSKDG